MGNGKLLYIYRLQYDGALRLVAWSRLLGGLAVDVVEDDVEDGAEPGIDESAMASPLLDPTRRLHALYSVVLVFRARLDQVQLVGGKVPRGQQHVVELELSPLRILLKIINVNNKRQTSANVYKRQQTRTYVNKCQHTNLVALARFLVGLRSPEAARPHVLVPEDYTLGVEI